MKGIDFIVIDDDPLIHSTIDILVDPSKTKVQCFYTYQELLQSKVLDELKKDTKFLIDMNLTYKDEGLDVSRELSLLGFWEITIFSGYEKEDILEGCNESETFLERLSFIPKNALASYLQQSQR